MDIYKLIYEYKFMCDICVIFRMMNEQVLELIIFDFKMRVRKKNEVERDDNEFCEYDFYLDLV